MPVLEKTLFICYRRKDVPWALLISQNLTHRGYDVFFDFQSIGSGAFERIITENIRERAHFLVLLTPKALIRCDDPNDWFRREIELAMEKKRNIIPIKLKGFNFEMKKSIDHLTGELENLKEYNAMGLTAEYFEAGMQRLCDDYLNKTLNSIKHPISKVIHKTIDEQKLVYYTLDSLGDSSLSAQQCFEQALRAKEPKEKLKLFSKTIYLDPTHVPALNNRGLSYHENFMYEQAIVDFKQAIELAPDFVVAYINRGISYFMLDQYKRAIQDFNTAIDLNPNLARPYCFRGNCFVKLNQYDQAIKDYNQTIELGHLNHNVYFNRGICYYIQKKYTKAIIDYKRVVKLQPDDSSAYNNLGLCYAKLEQYKNAFANYKKAIEANGEVSISFYNMACAYSLSGDVSEAINWLFKALSIESHKFYKMVENDSDFDNIRDDQAFRQLMAEFCDC